MTDIEQIKLVKRMYLIIPAMFLCMIGDYCIGIEPLGSKTVSGMISDGWLEIASWRITLSNICGLIGTFFYTVAALAFADYLKQSETSLKSKVDLWITRLYSGSLITGIMSFIYFHIACGMLIYKYPILLEATGGDSETAVKLWNKLFIPEIFPFVVLFVIFDVGASVLWGLMILRRNIALPKVWIFCAPLIVAGIGMLLSLLPLPFKGIESGFESLGWMLMFIGGARHINSVYDRA